MQAAGSLALTKDAALHGFGFENAGRKAPIHRPDCTIKMMVRPKSKARASFEAHIGDWS
jgi:hypothetical protein